MPRQLRTSTRRSGTTDLHALCEQAADTIGSQLRKCPDLAPEMASFAGQVLDHAREAACEKRAAEIRARRSKVIAVNMRAGRTILPTHRYPDLTYPDA